jgi:hypothetical protein
MICSSCACRSADELFLSSFRLLGLLQLRILLGELLDYAVALLLQLVDPGLALARQRGSARPARA